MNLNPSSSYDPNNILSKLGMKPIIMNLQNSESPMSFNMNFVPSQVPQQKLSPNNPSSILNNSKPLGAPARNPAYNTSLNFNSSGSNSISVNNIRTHNNDSSSNKNTICLTLDLREKSSLDSLKGTADQLMYRNWEKKHREEISEKNRKIDSLEKELRDTKSQLKKSHDEFEKLQKEYDKLAKKSLESTKSVNDQSTSIVPRPCKIDFMGLLNSPNFKPQECYTNFISNSGQIETRLHDEILEFQETIEKFNKKNNALFQKLIQIVTETISSSIADCTVNEIPQ